MIGLTKSNNLSALIFSSALVVMSGITLGASSDTIDASVPRLGGGNIEFAIPSALRPTVGLDFFTLSTDFPGFPHPDYSGTQARSVFLIVRTRPPYGTLATDILSGRHANLKELPEQDGYRVFIEHVPRETVTIRHYLFYDEHHNPVVVSDPGEWSRSYGLEHAFGEGYEIKAVINKEYGVDFKKIDKDTMNFVVSMIRR